MLLIIIILRFQNFFIFPPIHNHVEHVKDVLFQFDFWIIIPPNIRMISLRSFNQILMWIVNMIACSLIFNHLSEIFLTHNQVFLISYNLLYIKPNQIIFMFPVTYWKIFRVHTSGFIFVFSIHGLYLFIFVHEGWLIAVIFCTIFQLFVPETVPEIWVYLYKPFILSSCSTQWTMFPFPGLWQIMNIFNINRSPHDLDKV